ncbi:Alpha/Beta hydrolase protein [Fusarium oxysporum Fo47]|nr:Alpha/Beta hydrolase protein [Fusarium oxysporum Fo47]WJG34912.1 Alpha/Beta hydrolase protein [Fusarium oxysporum Fo47]
MSSKLYDVLIIGGGPGGLAMASALARQVYTALILDSGVYRNAPTKHMHNVLGFDHVEPSVFRQKARDDLEKRYESIEFKSTTIANVRKTDAGVFEAVDHDGNIYQGKKLGLGTGVKDLVEEQPKGYAECWGKGIFHCLYCHGFEERGAESVGVFSGGMLSSADMLAHVTPMAKRLSQSVTIYTNGDTSLPSTIKTKVHSSKVHFDTRKITSFALVNSGPSVKITFEDGSSKTEGFVVSHPNVAQAAPFAEQLGLETTPTGDIKVEVPMNETSVKGCFAFGDAATVMRSALQAMHMGEQKVPVSVGVSVSVETLTITMQGMEPSADDFTSQAHCPLASFTKKRALSFYLRSIAVTVVMMIKSLALFTLITVASARKCTNITVPVSLTSQNAVFTIEAPLTGIDVTTLAVNLARQGAPPYPEQVQKGFTTVSGNYELAATYCEPDAGPGKELQIMTHGIGFDRSYWDFPYNNYNYSYVARAVDEHGYSTLTWDRLGVGASSKGDPLNEIQVYLEIAALKALTTKAREGSLGVGCKYSKVVHLGHSFGSVISYALANESPELTDAVVLTGFSQATAYLGLFAVGSNFIPITATPLADKYPAGYVGVSSTVGIQINFFAEGDFDPKILEVAYEKGQPVSPGELLTLGAPAGKNNTYTGPVQIVTGSRDVPFCGDNCYSTGSVDPKLPSLLDISRQFFTQASRFNTTVVPGAGHGLNFGYSHTVTYDAILEFLSELA